jgi:hypothetical protein
LKLHPSRASWTVIICDVREGMTQTTKCLSDGWVKRLSDGERASRITCYPRYDGRTPGSLLLDLSSECGLCIIRISVFVCVTELDGIGTEEEVL